jgi:hypothetical protein
MLGDQAISLFRLAQRLHEALLLARRLGHREQVIHLERGLVKYAKTVPSMARRAVAIDAWPVMMSTSVVGNDALIERRRSVTNYARCLDLIGDCPTPLRIMKGPREGKRNELDEEGSKRKPCQKKASADCPGA